MRTMIAIAAASLFAATPALADAWDFVLTNSTAKEIKTIELAPTGTTTWQPNKVEADTGAKTFKPGARTTVHFDKGSACKYDIRATFADGSMAVWSAVNVCDSFVTVKGDGGNAFTTS